MFEIVGAHGTIKNSTFTDLHATTFVAVQRQTDDEQWVDLTAHNMNTSPRCHRRSLSPSLLSSYPVKMLYANSGVGDYS